MNANLGLVLLFVENPLKSSMFYQELFELAPVEESPTFVTTGWRSAWSFRGMFSFWWCRWALRCVEYKTINGLAKTDRHGFWTHLCYSRSRWPSDQSVQPVWRRISDPILTYHGEKGFPFKRGCVEIEPNDFEFVTKEIGVTNE